MPDPTNNSQRGIVIPEWLRWLVSILFAIVSGYITVQLSLNNLSNSIEQQKERNRVQDELNKENLRFRDETGRALSGSAEKVSGIEKRTERLENGKK